MNPFSFRYLLLTITLLFAISGCAAKAFRDGQHAFLHGEYDESVACFQEAVQRCPDNHEYRMFLHKARLQGALHHLRRGRQLRATGDLDAALQEFSLASILDPSLEAASQETLLTRQARQRRSDLEQARALTKDGELEKARRILDDILQVEPGDRQAKALLEEIETQLSSSKLSLASLFPGRKPLSLEFKKTDLREAFEIIGRLAGRNVILDKSVPKEMLDMELKDTTLWQSFELLLNLYDLRAKPLNQNTLLVFPDSGEKNKQYDDYKIKTCYLSHISAKQVVNLLRTMLKIKKIYVHEERNALVFRERPEVIELAERIIAAADRADAEVLFELELIEVNHSDTLLFGPTLNPSSVSLGLAKGDNVVASGLSAGDATDNLVGSLNGLKSVYTLPTAVFDFQKTLVDSEILATPKIRVKNRGKAKVHVGRREPVITVTTTGETSTDNIQYVDVGVKLDIEPQIQLDGTVITSLSLEVSSVTEKTTTANGSLALSISTTNAQTSLTLKNGERTVIGGLIRNDNTKTRKIIPILGDLPLIGNLFTNHNKDKKKREILLSITTHILQNVDLPTSSLTDIWSGGEDDLKPVANFSSFLVPVEPAEEPSDTTQPAEPTPPAQEESPANATLPVDSAIDSPLEAPPILEEKLEEQPAVGFSEDSRPNFLLTAPPAVSVGETFDVTIGIADVSDLYSAPMILSYNGEQLEIADIDEGDFLGQDGEDTTFIAQQNADQRGGTIDYKRLAGQAGRSGSGTLATLRCKARASGQVLLGIAGNGFRDSLDQPLAVPARKILLNIKQP